MDKDTKSLGIEPVGRLLFRFSAPAVVAMLVDTIYNATDKWFVSHVVGSDGMAAISVIWPLFALYITIELLCGIGGSTLFSIKLGEGDEEGARRVLGNTLSLQIALFSAYALAAGLWLEEILAFSGASEATMPHAKSYFGTLMVGLGFNMVGQGLNNFVRALGHPRRAMLNSIMGPALNIFLDYLFMMEFGWGMFGAALATTIGCSVMFGLVTQFFLARKSPMKLAPARPDYRLISTIFKFGMSPFFLHLTFVVNGIVINAMTIKYGGDFALAGGGIANTIMSFCLMPVFGITQGMQSIAGYNYGAKKWDRLRRVLKLTLIAVSAWIIAFTALVVLGKTDLVLLFDGGKSGEGVLEFAEWMLGVNTTAFPLLGIVFIAATYMLATGKYMRSLFLNMTRQLAFLLPLILILPRHFGLKGLIWAFPTADWGAIVLASAMLRREWKSISAKADKTP